MSNRESPQQKYFESEAKRQYVLPEHEPIYPGRTPSLAKQNNIGYVC